MDVVIIDFEITETNGNRVHLEINGKQMSVLLLENELTSASAAEQAIRKLLKGYDLIGHSFIV